MAKTEKRDSGSWSIVVRFQGNRRRLTLGNISKREADYFAMNLDKLIDSVRYGSAINPATKAWLDELCEDHVRTLSDVGLFGFHSSKITVKKLFDHFLESYPNKLTKNGFSVTESSVNTMTRALARFPPRFTKRIIADLEPKVVSIRSNADPVFTDEVKQIFTKLNSWQRNFYAVSTWSRDNSRISEVGNWAVANGYCDFNPFALLPSPGEVNPSRNVKVEADVILDVMENCIDEDTRTSLALGRFQGVRAPKELRTMKWKHVDFKKRQLTVIDCKSHKERIMPLFDRCHAELKRQHKLTGDTRFVMSPRFLSYSDSNNYNLICEACERAGYRREGHAAPWERLRQNLRASCENELLKVFPEWKVVAWIGHSQKVSRESYQKQDDDVYMDAIEKVRTSPKLSF